MAISYKFTDIITNRELKELNVPKITNLLYYLCDMFSPDKSMYLADEILEVIVIPNNEDTFYVYEIRIKFIIPLAENIFNITKTVYLTKKGKYLLVSKLKTIEYTWTINLCRAIYRDIRVDINDSLDNLKLQINQRFENDHQE